MRRPVLWLGMALAVPVLSGAGVGRSVTAPTTDSAAAGCTITVKARRNPGTGGADPISIWLNYPGASKVRIKRGTWSRLGGGRDPAVVTFAPDGTWRQSTPDRTGSGEWSGEFNLRMGCRYNRRYQFEMGTGIGATRYVRPQYPSSSTFTQSQTITLGNVARYF